MPTQEVERFAELLIREVRDRAIASCDALLESAANNVTSKRWRDQMQGASSTELVSATIPDCVDQTLFHLLDAIDTGVLRMSIVTPDGTVVDLTAAGMREMAGWYMGSDGWRSSYSQQRFADDCEDLAGTTFS